MKNKKNKKRKLKRTPQQLQRIYQRQMELMEKNNIKTVATQERFITTFYTSYVNVMLDTYYTASEYTANFVKNSKYYDVKNAIPVGQYRSDYISLYKNSSWLVYAIGVYIQIELNGFKYLFISHYTVLFIASLDQSLQDSYYYYYYDYHD